MPSQIDQAFDDMISAATSDVERDALRDAKQVANIVRRVASPSDRHAIIAVLSEFDTLAELADAIAERRIIPFPARVTTGST